MCLYVAYENTGLDSPTQRFSQHEKKWPVQEGLSALKEN
jgi:hypothetical protein